MVFSFRVGFCSDSWLVLLCCPLKVSEILSLSRSEGPTRVSWGQRGSFHCGARGEPTQSQLTSCDSRNLPSCLEVPLSGTLLWLSAPHTDAPTSSLLPFWCSHLTFCSLAGKCTPFFTSSFTRTSLCHHTSGFQALLLTLWTFLFSTGWFSLAGGPPCPAGLSGDLDGAAHLFVQSAPSFSTGFGLCLPCSHSP